MTVPAAARTLDLIEVLAHECRPMTVSALAKAMNVPVSSCHGMIKTLEARGYLVELKNQGGYYFTKLLMLQAERIASYDIIPDWLSNALKNLCAVSRETVVLAKLTGTNATYVEVLESARSIRYIVRVGDVRPLHATAVGKAILGSMTSQERDQVMRRFKFIKRNGRTITTKADLLSDLATSQARGWYCTRGEYLEEVSAVSVPLTLGGERYACGIAGPSVRMEASIGHYAAALVSALDIER